MDPLLVDVNVHPTKREVRLSKEPELTNLVTQTVRQVLGSVDLIPDALTNLRSHQPKVDLEQLQIDLQRASQTTGFEDRGKASKTQPTDFPSVTPAMPSTPTALPTGSSRQADQVDPTKTDKSEPQVSESDPAYQADQDQVPSTEATSAATTPADPAPTSFGAAKLDTSEPVSNIFQNPTALARWDAWLQADEQPRAFAATGTQPNQRHQNSTAAAFVPTTEENSGHTTDTPPVSATIGAKSAQTVPTEPPAATQRRFPELRYLGQIHGTYLVAESDDGFYLIDQHAAQERIKYEQFRVSFGQVAQDQQNLLVPLVLTYPASDYVQIKAHLALLADVGLALEDFGENTFILHSHPVWFQSGQEEKLIREMIDYFLGDGQISVAHFREKAAIMLSCKLSIKANHHLEPIQAKQLLHDLAQTENPFNCPHGRPVLVHFNNQDLQKMFKRIQDPHQSWSGD